MSSDSFEEASGGRRPQPLWSTRTRGVVAIHGEVDICTRELFAAMLQAAIARAKGGGARRQVHIDLGGLDFIDVSGARVLVTAVAELGPDCQLIVHRPPAQLARILDLGWGELGSLRLENGHPEAGSDYRSISKRGRIGPL